jgi:hypothetical protein
MSPDLAAAVARVDASFAPRMHPTEQRQMTTGPGGCTIGPGRLRLYDWQIIKAALATPPATLNDAETESAYPPEPCATPPPLPSS